MFFQLGQRMTSIWKGLPGPYWVLWIGTLINRLGMVVLPFLTLYLTGIRGFSISQAALIVSLFGIGSCCASLSGGVLADTLGRRRTILFGLVFTGIILLVFGSVQSLPIIAGLALLLGFGTDLIRPAISACVADLVAASDRIRAYGLLYWAVNIGAAIAPLLAGFMIRFSSWLLFVIDSITTLIFSILCWFSLPETLSHVVSGQRGAEKRQHMLQALRDPLLLSYSGLTFLFACIFFQGYVTLPFAMKAHGLNETDYGIAIAMNGVIIVIVSLPLNHLLRRFHRGIVLASAAILMGLGFGLTEIGHTTVWYAFTVIIWTFGELMAVPVSSAIIADLAPAQSRGIYQGMYGVAWSLASFAGPVLGGLVLDTLGSATLWTGCFTVGLVIASGYLLLARKTRLKLETIK